MPCSDEGYSIAAETSAFLIKVYAGFEDTLLNMDTSQQRTSLRKHIRESDCRLAKMLFFCSTVHVSAMEPSSGHGSIDKTLCAAKNRQPAV